MKRTTLAVSLLIVALPVFALGFEVGGIAGGGLVFTSGSFLDFKSSQLAELGAASLGTAGSSSSELFPCWSGGGYAELAFSRWFALRMEAKASFQGASRLALTDTGAALDRYGIYFFSAMLPVLARGRLPLWGGAATVSAGPFLGIVTGNISLIDRYATSTVTASVAQGFFNGMYLGLTGGLGYSHPMGPGVASAEVRADWAVTSATAEAGELGGTVYPLSVSLMLSYGFPVRGTSK